MKNRSWLYLLISLSVFVLIISNTSAFALSYPESVRVGLYFGSSSAANVSLKAKSGLEIGYYQNGQFVSILAVAGGQQAVVRKDAYFIKTSSGSLTEYNPTEGVPFTGETFGPYHIKIGDNLSDFSSAQGLVNTLKQSGVSAYPAYENNWGVWTGFYADKDTADKEMLNLSAKLNSTPLSVVIPSSSRLIAYNNDFEPSFIFGSADLKLIARPDSSNNPRVISINGKQYRGEVEFRRFSNSDMTVINIINIEEYLYGVVPGEIESYSPIEAIKAQAVAARTYTYLSMGKYKKWDFDVVNTVDSQVYGGFDIEHPATNRAVEETKGKKVLYNGKLASLFYFSSSGGMTEDNINVWGSSIPYLKSVPDPYEAGNSYNYTWTRTMTAADIKMKLFLSGVEIGDIISMTVEEYTPAGRANKLKIVGTQSSITYYKEDIRKILGSNGYYLPSRMFAINSGGAAGGNGIVSVISADGQSSVNVYGTKAVTSTGVLDISTGAGSLKIFGSETSSVITGTIPSNTYVLTGKGWGHAIGMSQEGAKGFAKNGYTYDKILMHYFTGVTVE